MNIFRLWVSLQFSGDGSSWFDVAFLDAFLAIDAIGGPGKRLDPFGPDGLVAADAIAKRSISKAYQCLAH